jgi:aminopeptidase N
VNLHAQFRKAERQRARDISFPTACAPGYSPHEEDYDVNFYFIDLEATNKSTYLRGSSTLHAKRIAEEIDTFVVELSQKLYADSVFLQETKQTLFYQQGDLLKIAVQPGMKKEAEYRLKVYYQGASGTGGFFGGISSVNAPFVNKRITYTLSEPYQAKDWFPVKQNLKDKADSVWIFITVDSTLKAGSNGLLTAIRPLADGKNRYEWKSNYPIAYYLLSITVGDYIDYSYYAKLSDNDSVLVQNYIYNFPGNLENNKADIDQTGVFLKLYSDVFGKYPFAKEKYGHCEAPMGGGMEHQTMTTLSSFEFGLVSHELAHQWFGDYLTCGTWQDIWINEGFASYAEYIALEGLKTKEDAIAWLDEAHNYAINYPYSGIYLSAEESQDVSRMFNYGLTYKKGGAIIHMLRYEINNDSLFFAIIKDYLKSFGNSTATGADFRQVVEKHTGEDFGWFFEQWYYGKGHPIFVTNWRQIGDTLIITSSQTSSADDNSFFRTHLDYRIHYKNGETEDIRVNYEKPGEVFMMNTPKEIIFVQTDPFSNVLNNAVVYKYTDPTKVFSLSPNPFKTELNISFRNNNKHREIKLTDLSGKIVSVQATTSGFFTLSIPHLKTGIYLLYVTEDGITYTEKVVKL